MARILIVDDEESIRVLLQVILRRGGYEVECANDATTAQQILQSGTIDVVISDIYLPGMSGVELLRFIRMVAPRVQVILITGGPSLATATDAVRAGAFDYLSKPIPKDTILRSVALAVRVQAIDDERRRAVEELQRARLEKDELERTRQMQLRMKDEFLSHVSHELLSPLTAVHQFVSLVHDGLAGDVRDEQREYLAIALKNVRQLQTLIGDLLDVSRAQKDKLPVQLRPVFLSECILVALDTVRHEARRKNLALTVQMDAGLPTAYADPQRVQQVVINLVNNAIKFTPDGGSIQVRADVVKDPPGVIDMLCVSVADTGCGIRHEHQERIFDQLYQVNRAADQNRGGLGLGLYICRDLIARQNGRIWVTSRPGEGSTFSFTLPIYNPRLPVDGGAP